MQVQEEKEPLRVIFAGALPHMNHLIMQQSSLPNHCVSACYLDPSQHWV